MAPEQWIERYRRSWETADEDEIADLFTPDAWYGSSVFREPFAGIEAIREYWRRGAGSQQEVVVRMGQPIVTDARVAVEWWTTMVDPDEGEVTLPGCLLLRSFLAPRHRVARDSALSRAKPSARSGASAA